MVRHLPWFHVRASHLIVQWKGSEKAPVTTTRTKEEAKVLAEKVYAEVVAGGDFGALVKQHTNDSAPGIYPMTKAGRAGMVQAFGDVGFRLKVGEVGTLRTDDGSSKPFHVEASEGKKWWYDEKAIELADPGAAPVAEAVRPEGFSHT